MLMKSKGKRKTYIEPSAKSIATDAFVCRLKCKFDT